MELMTPAKQRNILCSGSSGKRGTGGWVGEFSGLQIAEVELL